MPLLDALGVKKLVEQILDDTYSKAKDAFSELKIQGKIVLQIGIQRYLERLYPSVCAIKTLVIPDRTVDIDDVYVAPSFNEGRVRFSEANIDEKIYNGSRYLIAGIAGQGKSVFLKWMFSCFVRENRGRIPVYIQLRDYNSSITGISNWIGITILGADASQGEYIEKLVQNTPLLVLLDGLDEVDPGDRPKIKRMIRAFVDSYPHAATFIATRPDRDIVSWNDFQVLRISAYSQRQAVQLVNKFPVSAQLRRPFIQRMHEEYLARYPVFFENPLLIGMMFLTFWKNNYIPEKEHLVYEKAFDALHFAHDQTKFLYKRKMFSNLGDDDFKRAWTLFCFVTYIDLDYTVSRDSIRSSTEKINKLGNFSLIYDDFIRDLTESVCVMLEDGTEYSFIHRSFQEYYCAKFFMSRASPQLVDVLAVCSTRFGDGVLAFCRDIDPHYFRVNYVLPCLEKVRDFIERNNCIKRPSIYFRSMYSNITIDFEPSLSDVPSGRAVSYGLPADPKMKMMHAYSSVFNDDLDKTMIPITTEEELSWFISNFEEDSQGIIDISLDDAPSRLLDRGPLASWVKADFDMICAAIEQIERDKANNERNLSDILIGI
jgi:hypothetical protein